MLFGMQEERPRWVAYDDGTHEPVDPAGDLKRKKRGAGKQDWWVEEREQGWLPESFAPTKRGQDAKRRVQQGKNPVPEPRAPDQHADTGHAQAVTDKDGEVRVKPLGTATAKPRADSARDARALKQAEAEAKRPNSARDVRGLKAAEKKQRPAPRNSARDAREMEAEAARDKRSPGRKIMDGFGELVEVTPGQSENWPTPPRRASARP